MHWDLDVHKFQAEVRRVTGVGIGLNGAEEVEVVIKGVLYQPAVEVVGAGQQLTSVVNESDVAPGKCHLVLDESKASGEVRCKYYIIHQKLTYVYTHTHAPHTKTPHTKTPHTCMQMHTLLAPDL